MRLRGELCVSFGSLLSFVAMLLLIFVHVGQINTSTVPRNIYMAKVNVSTYGDAIHFAIIDPVFGLYTDNASAPLGAEAGLRQFYKFGIYSHCGFVNDTAGRCSNQTVGDQFRPFDVMTSDMRANWSIFSQSFVSTSATFRNSSYLGHNSKGAYYMILLGTLLAAAAFIAGLPRHNMTFLISTVFSIAGSVLLLIGCSIWTVTIQRTAAINDFFVQSGNQQMPLGIVVSSGPGLYLLWAGFACLMASIVPYMISCCTFK